MNNYKLTLSYDGSRYRGWQRQGNTENTIQGKVEAALSRILGQEIEISGSGRTDAGAHARMQVASFRAETGMDTSDILSRLREALPEDIAALELSIAEPRFHARLSCVGKTYIYRVQNSAVQNVFERKYMYRVSEALDIGAMQDAAKVLLGEHDFTAFQSNKRMKKSAVRRIDTIDITRIGDEIRFTVSGNGFLYNMVRIIVGTLLEAGAHRMSAEDVKRALESKVRENAGPTVPGQGLTLAFVAAAAAIESHLIRRKRHLPLKGKAMTYLRHVSGAKRTSMGKISRRPRNMSKHRTALLIILSPETPMVKVFESMP